MVVLSFLFLIIFYLLGLAGLILSADTSLIGEASRWCERVSAGAFREPVIHLIIMHLWIIVCF